MSGERAKDHYGRKLLRGDVLDHRFVVIRPTRDGSGRFLVFDMERGTQDFLKDNRVLTERGEQKIGDPRDMDGGVVDVGTRLCGQGYINLTVETLREDDVVYSAPTGRRGVISHDLLSSDYRIAPPKIKTTITVVHDTNRDPAAVIRGAGMEVEDG